MTVPYTFKYRPNKTEEEYKEEIRYNFPICCDKALRLILTPELVEVLTKLVLFLKRDITVTSGIRCSECNSNVGGVLNSAHLKGMAADISYKGGRDLYDKITALLKIGVNRIGIDKTYIHFDIDRAKQEFVMWIYK